MENPKIEDKIEELAGEGQSQSQSQSNNNMMISLHFAGASRRRVYVAIRSPLHSASISPNPFVRTFTSKRPPSHNNHNTKSSTELDEKHKLEQDERARNRHREERGKSHGFKKPRRKEWKRPGKDDTGPKILQQSGYFYDLRRRDGDDNQSSSPKLPIVSLDASALLDPLAYCKTSAKVAHTHGVSQSISGTDAARRLLRGKREFISVARSIRSPALLTGHGVPPELLQHCIDMADALMQFYGPNTVEISFHNYNHENSNETKLPHILRIRGQDGTNRCSNWPMPTTVDWDYHMSLYVTVMERLVRNLGLVLAGRSEPDQSIMGDEESEERNYCDVMSSPLLFPNSSHIPQWNVGILRGGVFQFFNGADGKPNDDVKPCPIVELSHLHHDSEILGHLLIRLQGNSLPNRAFHVGKTGRRVSLVFDACFR